MATNGPSFEDDNQLNDFGADVFQELFGDPENPGTLLWMANGIYNTANRILDCCFSPFKGQKIKLD